MQPSTTGGGGGGGGGGGAGGGGGGGGGGLARYRSAPPTWLEALLEEEVEEEGGGGDEDPLKRNQTLTQLLSSSTTTVSSRNSMAFGTSDNMFEGGAGGGFPRQNSSPADFLVNSGIGNDGYFSNYGIPSNCEYISSSSTATSTTMDAVASPSVGKRPTFHHSSASKNPSLVKVEQTSQIPSSGGMSSLIEMEMEKLLEDSVPCRVRAKRGCATHPRSIAERVRRTRISDRIRKLQELVPDMDKQTNTADMLDEAVEYVKFLQKQIQELTEQQRKCTCMAKELQE